ncbi:hypothetical protein ACIRBX_24785 [Kitasatospora sp. NPDC096147]|uniref:hypothetical protein n=1 Tax=Kitasatospora sp. NPDC096147 TaxID=3364093 RepID=UPI003818635C
MEQAAVSPEDVDEIAALADPVLRNLRITLAYHDLSLAMGTVLGRENVSWCAFGTWASRTAGRSIRGDSAPSIVRAALTFAQRMPPLLRPVAGLPQAIVRQVSENVAYGNLIVFQDLGPLFAALAEHLGQPGPPEQVAEVAVERCCASLRPGPAEEGGQDLLAEAIRSYSHAFVSADANERAEHVLLANLRIGLHEQIRLQEPIARALTWPADMRAAPLPLRARLQRSWASTVTRQLMDLALPAPAFATTRALVSQRIGSDVKGSTSSAPFPSALARLRNTDLKALLYDIDRTPNTLAGSAAADWVQLGDRMNFVADLFRARQQEQLLFRAPFTPEQTEAIRRGEIPADPDI